MGRFSKALLLAGVSFAVYGKLSYRNARLIALVKRLLTFFISKVLQLPDEPELLLGLDAAKQIGDLMVKLKCKKPILLTDRTLVECKIVDPIRASLAAAGLEHAIFDGVLPDPDVKTVEEAYAHYKSAACDSVIAVGGGSVIDVGKMVGAKACNPKPVDSMRGAFMVTYGLWSLPPLVAVPTTAGSGSERTMAAVVSTRRGKALLVDTQLMPKAAVLDPKLLVNLPKAMTAATGMDALTHAIEAHLGLLRGGRVSKHSFEAIELIYKHLLRCYNHGDDLEARQKMLEAAFLAGAAANEANVGLVHAFGHNLGALFHVPHGLANAMCLPYVLEFYLEDEREGSEEATCTDLFCQMAKAAGLAKEIPGELLARKALARQFVDSIFELRAAMDMQTEVPQMTSADVPVLAQRALNETDGCSQGNINPIRYLMEVGYQPPKYMSLRDAEKVALRLLPKSTCS